MAEAPNKEPATPAPQAEVSPAQGVKPRIVERHQEPDAKRVVEPRAVDLSTRKSKSHGKS